ncbi:PhoU domain-containing protein [Enterococcus faecium]
MSDYVKKMVDNVLVAYVKTDEKDARTIANMDQRVNDYFNRIYNATIKNMQENPRDSHQWNRLLECCQLSRTDRRLCDKHL